MTTTLYSPAVLALSKDVSAAGEARDPTHTATWDNPLCGDRVTVSLRVECAAVADLRHVTRGCALCRASAALMARTVPGRRVDEVTALAQACIAALEGTGPPEVPDLLADFAGLERAPARASCVSLPWQGLARALRAGEPTPAPVGSERPG